MPKAEKWTTEETDFLRENFQTMSHAEMSLHLHLPLRSVKAVKQRCKILGLVKKRFCWTEESIEMLKSRYSDTKTETIAAELGCSMSALYQKAWSLGLYKSEDFLKSPECGRLLKGVRRSPGTEFKKGHTTWNTGLKGLHFEGSEKGHFKKGNTAHNSVPIGTESTIQGYVKVKIAEPNFWKWKQRLVWEQHHGEIPKGFVVIFKDGNRLNFSIENLEMISKKESRRRNSIHELYTPELRQTIHQLAGFKRRINKLKEKQNA